MNEDMPLRFEINDGSGYEIGRLYEVFTCSLTRRVLLAFSNIVNMATDKNDLIEILVADSAAFLKNVSLQNMAKNIYTINEVVGEIRSAAVRQRLAVLPYEIIFRVPSGESLHVGENIK